MTPVLRLTFALLFFLSVADVASAQHPPSLGYMFPPGAPAGQTTEVILGGYDWTPDMQLFVQDPQIKVELIGPLSPVIVPEPPYWIGKKARRPPFPLPREVRARLSIPAGVATGPVKWQAANANGATAAGTFMVLKTSELRESPDRSVPQHIDSLPVCISGQIRHIREVDQYTFTAAASGPITCDVLARRIDSPLNAFLEVRDQTGRLVADTADTAGTDTMLTFATVAGESYCVSIFDLDFRGNRSFVYQLSLTPGPRVVTANPWIVRPGATQTIELIGYGLAGGGGALESVTRTITFPQEEHVDSYSFQLQTEFGTCPPFVFRLSPAALTAEEASKLTLPVEVTGIIRERYGEDSYRIAGTKDELWAIHVSGQQSGSHVDPTVAILNHDGKELARNDDFGTATDARIDFKVPADGEYQILVSDVSSSGGTRAATYALSVRNAVPDFDLSLPELLNVPIDGKANLPLKVTRYGGCSEAIAISLSGLPGGVTVPDNLEVPAGKTALNIECTVAPDAAASAASVRLTGTATSGDTVVRRESDAVLVATTIKPPFTVDAEGKDDVTKWPRGTTFPAPVLISREEGFDEEIVLEMTSRQGRHRQGISGPELVVESGLTRVLYPVWLPEWLETTRTSRMVVNGVARVKDPQGNVRYSVSRQKTRMGFLPTGALLKIAAVEDEFQSRPGQSIEVPISIDRSDSLTEPLVLELCCESWQQSLFAAELKELAPDVSEAVVTINVADVAADAIPESEVMSEHRLKIRATLLKDGHLPVISETSVLIELVD